VAVSVFKTACDPSYVGLGGFDSHALPPFDPARLSHLRRLVKQHRSILLFVASFAACTNAIAQSAASAAVLPVVPADSVRPPITPKRAFLSSLLVPGSAQNRLGRHRAAAALIGVEAMSIAMIRESGADVREARQQAGDTLVVSYVDDKGDRLPTPLLQRRRFGDVEVRSRRSHVEDWVALLIANHLFAACDAFVAANLWDVAAHVTMSGSKEQLLIGGRLSW
jgi:hypothetical protein